jgi:hypothetical protein
VNSPAAFITRASDNGATFVYDPAKCAANESTNDERFDAQRAANECSANGRLHAHGNVYNNEHMETYTTINQIYISNDGIPLPSIMSLLVKMAKPLLKLPHMSTMPRQSTNCNLLKEHIN